MKKFLTLLVVIGLCSFPCFAEQTADSQISLDFQDEPETYQAGAKEYIETAIEVGYYFEKNYPGEFIEKDLKPDIAKFFPHLTDQQLYDREDTIRSLVKTFRWGKEKYNQIKAMFLTPDTPVLTYKDEDYEVPDNTPYVDVGENKVLITTDIKKVLSYSQNPKEVESYEHFLERKNKLKKIETAFPEFAKLKEIFSKIEFKKFPLYGIVYDDPIAEGKGESPWTDIGESQIRLISEKNKIDKNDEMRFAIHFATPDNIRILAQQYQEYPKIKLDFSKSENIKSCDSFRPFPERTLFNDGDLITYPNNFAFPIICKIDDINKPARLKADIRFSSCNADKKCQTHNGSVSLNMENGLSFSTPSSNFITQSFNFLPYAYEKDLKLKDVSIETNKDIPSGQTLRIIADLPQKGARPEVFAETADNISFSRPRIAIDGHTMTARLDVLTPDANLENTEAEILIKTDSYDSYRLLRTINSASVFDILAGKLSLGMILLAILGGFILNFMPCVFPVLSIKLLSLTKFGGLNTKQIKANLGISVLGIFTAFIIMSGILALLKAGGHMLGWGMQFQNPYFITAMIFVILLFIAQLNGLFYLKIPFSDKLAAQTNSKFINFFSGVLIVIMATPCTAPYLGTTIGFALAGNTYDIFAILLSVALGLSLPYLLLLVLPDLSVLIPHPGPWMHKLNKIMLFMLFLTLIWLYCILLAQSSWTNLLWVIAFGILFYMIIYLAYHTRLQLETTPLDDDVKHIVPKMLATVYAALLMLFFGSALYMTSGGFEKNRQQNQTQQQTAINYSLIQKSINDGHNVIVNVGADWCLTCSYNNVVIFDNPAIQNLIDQYGIKFINIDWTGYNREILEFMSRYGRRGLPFYILYNKNIPDGIVLPEVLSIMELEKILKDANIQY